MGPMLLQEETRLPGENLQCLVESNWTTFVSHLLHLMQDMLQINVIYDMIMRCVVIFYILEYLQTFMPEKIKCFQTSVETNVTLNGGLTAGNFTAVGHVETIDACAKLCCVRDNCDLALLVNDHCFMVSCQNVEQCSSMPIKNSVFQTYIARVNRTKEIANSQQTGKHLD